MAMLLRSSLPLKINGRRGKIFLLSGRHSHPPPCLNGTTIKKKIAASHITCPWFFDCVHSEFFGLASWNIMFSNHVKLVTLYDKKCYIVFMGITGGRIILISRSRAVVSSCFQNSFFLLRKFDLEKQIYSP